jgi:hypothetical protein
MKRALQKAKRDAVKWAKAELKRLLAEGRNPQDAAEEILIAVSRRLYGIGCQVAVSKELNLHFRQQEEENGRTKTA